MARARIFTRGNPGGFDIHGNPTEEVHVIYYRDTCEGRKIEPYCRSGAYHIMYTDDISVATCPRCLAVADVINN